MILTRWKTVFQVKSILPFLFVLMLMLFVGSVYAQDDTGSGGTYDDCGLSLSEYMNAVIAAKCSGNGNQLGCIPDNVKLLSPAFNMTSTNTLPGIVDGMVDGNANFCGLDGIAGNVYNTSLLDTISFYLEHKIAPQMAKMCGGGKPLYITETGTANGNYSGGRFNDVNYLLLLSELSNINNHGIDVRAALLFNGMNTNLGWSQFAFDDDKLRELASKSPGKIGMNFATPYSRDAGTYQKARDSGMAWTLEIASNDVTPVITGVNNALSRGMTPIIRIGVGSDAGGFGSVGSYTDFLSKVGNSVGGIVYAIAGPNEPDLEHWLADCDPYGYSTSAKLCTAEFHKEIRVYKPNIIGIHTPPFVLTGHLKDTGDAGSGRSGLAEALQANLNLTIEEFNYPDLRPLIRQNVGTPRQYPLAPGGMVPSVDAGEFPAYSYNDFFDINDRSTGYVEGVTDDDGNVKYEHPPLHLISQVPKQEFAGSFDVGNKDFQRLGEDYDGYTKRLFPAPNPNKLGKKSEMPVAFVGCVQSYPCDPKSYGADENGCLKLNYVFDPYASPEDAQKAYQCDKSKNGSGECISYGQIITFTSDDTKLNEKSHPFVSSRGAYDFQQKVVATPDQIGRWRSMTTYDLRKDASMDGFAQVPNGIGSLGSSLGSPTRVYADPPSGGNVACIDADNDPSTPDECFPGCTYSDTAGWNCYGASGQAPLWQPALKLRCSGGTCIVVYEVRTFWSFGVSGSPYYKDGLCRIDHFGMQVYAYNLSTGVGYGGEMAPGGSDADTGNRGQGGNWGAGMGDGGYRLPSFEHMPLGPGECMRVSFRLYGRNSGPPKICNKMQHDISQTCQICMNDDGTPGSNTCDASFRIANPPPIDCRKCESWAPKGLCYGSGGHEALTETIRGCHVNCESGLIRMAPTRDINFEETVVSGEESDKKNVDYTSGGDVVDLSNLCGYVNIPGVCTSNEIAGAECVYWKECTGEYRCTNNSSIECTQGLGECGIGGVCRCKKRKRYQCAVANKKYMLYTYPTNLLGKANQYRNEDMSFHDAMFLIPGITDDYFDPEGAIAPITVRLDVVAGSVKYIKEGVSREPGLEENKKWDDIYIGCRTLDPGDEGFEECKKRNDKGGMNAYGILHPYEDVSPSSLQGPKRVLNIEYFDLYNPQMTGHCLKNAFLSLPDEFPASQAELCSYVDGLGVTASRESTLSNANPNNAQSDQVGSSSEGGFEAAPALAAPPVEAVGNSGQDTRSSDAGSVSTPQTPPAPVDKEVIRERFLRDFEKLLEKYGDQIKTKNPTAEDLPPEMLKELNELSKKYKEQYDL